MTVELMIYALVAAGLVFWLRSILGTKSDDNSSPKLELNNEGKIVGIGGANNSGGSEKMISMIKELASTPKGSMLIAGGNAEEGLIEIAKAEKDFDIYIFLQAAQDAFVYIVESFAEGDRETLKDLLGEKVFNAFNASITQREEDKETMISEIQAIKKSEVLEASLNGKDALITVRFLADETSVIKDEEGNIIHGHPEKVTLMRDVWTFSRNIKSRDPRWLVVETREDGEEDNEIIPNTH